MVWLSGANCVNFNCTSNCWSLRFCQLHVGAGFAEHAQHNNYNLTLSVLQRRNAKIWTAALTFLSFLCRSLIKIVLGRWNPANGYKHHIHTVPCVGCFLFRCLPRKPQFLGSLKTRSFPLQKTNSHFPAPKITGHWVTLNDRIWRWDVLSVFWCKNLDPLLTLSKTSFLTPKRIQLLCTASQKH